MLTPGTDVHTQSRTVLLDVHMYPVVYTVRYTVQIHHAHCTLYIYTVHIHCTLVHCILHIWSQSMLGAHCLSHTLYLPANNR